MAIRHGTCKQYRLDGTPCTRRCAPNKKWCGVCAGLSTPGERLASHRRSSLVEQAATIAALGPDREPKVEEWERAAERVDHYAGVDDETLDAALRDRHLDLPAASAALSEAEVCRRPGIHEAAQRVGARAEMLRTAHANAVGDGPDVGWQRQLWGLHESLEARREDIQDRLGGAPLEDEGSWEDEGRMAAHADFGASLAGEALHNPGAFDTWVDMKMSAGGYPYPPSRSRVKGYRAELALISAGAYAGVGTAP